MKTILRWPGMCCALLMEQEADESMTALQVWTNTNGNASKQEDSPAEKHKSNTKRNIGGQDEEQSWTSQGKYDIVVGYIL